MDVPRVGVAAVVLRGGSVLMGLRKGSHGAGTWGFPGGHLEPGERFYQACSRELLEETGIKIQPGRFDKLGFSNAIFSTEQKHYITLLCVAEWKQGDGEAVIQEPNKCEYWKWWFDLPEKLFLPVDALIDSRLPKDDRSVQKFLEVALGPYCYVANKLKVRP
jgi:8-oxo-dGTP diphosphatase